MRFDFYFSTMEYGTECVCVCMRLRLFALEQSHVFSCPTEFNVFGITSFFSVCLNPHVRFYIDFSFCFLDLSVHYWLHWMALIIYRSAFWYVLKYNIHHIIGKEYNYFLYGIFDNVTQMPTFLMDAVTALPIFHLTTFSHSKFYNQHRIHVTLNGWVTIRISFHPHDIHHALRFEKQKKKQSNLTMQSIHCVTEEFHWIKIEEDEIRNAHTHAHKTVTDYRFRNV